jgi:RNA polymerase sigma factor (sigma-70 family)
MGSSRVYEVMPYTSQATAGALEIGGLAGAPPTWVTAEEIASLYLPRVHRFAVMLCPPGADPEDLVQQAMLRAIEQADHRLLRRETAEAWLWRVVVNTARDHGRWVRRSRLMLQRLVAGWDRGLAGASPERLALERIRDADLVAAVHRLPSNHRHLIALRYGADLTPTQIAQCTGTSRMAVTKALRRALDHLRADLADMELG